MDRHALGLTRSRRLLFAILLFAQPAAHSEPEVSTPRRAPVPDAELVDQDGKKVHLRSDLLKDRLAVISFIFTSCPTICSTIGINVGQLRKELGPSLERDVTLISISIDPTNDTPEKLQTWGKRFGAGKGWSLLTGTKDSVTALLKNLEAYTPDIQSHSPFLLVVNDRTGEWQRINALELSPVKIASLLKEELERGGGRPRNSLSDTAPPAPLTGESTADSPARRYFTDVKLTNQDGKEFRLYSDLLQGKVVVINSFFSGCTGVCKVTMPLFHSLQEKFSEASGTKLHFISISVDPEADTPETLRKYAVGVGAKSGWDFLTGDKHSVDLALGKLGFASEIKEGHSNVFIVGNESTGLWKKVLGIGSPAEIAAAVESVLADGRQ